DVDFLNQSVRLDWSYAQRICLIGIDGSVGLDHVIGDLQVEDIIGNRNRGETVDLPHQARGLHRAASGRHFDEVSDSKKAAGGDVGIGAGSSGCGCGRGNVVGNAAAALVQVERVA